MSSFFLPSKTNKRDLRKRKKGIVTKKDTRRTKVVKRDAKIADDDIGSESEDDEKESDLFKSLKVDESFSDEEETAPEKRLRLAKEYLNTLEEKEKHDKNTDDVDYDAVAHRLHDEILEQSGKLHKKIADQYIAPGADSVKFYKGHRLSVTSLVVTTNSQYVYTGGKDCTIIKWNLSSGNKEVVFIGHRRGLTETVGHTGHVLALAISTDDKYLASGGSDKVIHIWDCVTSFHLHTFRGHKDAVSGLVFQRGSHQLFSSSFDRTVKIWNLDEMIYVETLFGHQDAVVAIDCLSQERPVTAGANDKTLRVWKIVDESQLVFHGHKASIDTVKLIDEQNFISGSQDGSIALWNVMKKKPQAIQRHSPDKTGEYWVTAVTALPHTDLVVSGSRDGLIHFWKCGEQFRSLEHLFSVPVPGFVNCLSFTKHGNYLIAGIGQEHRFGRWWKDSEAKNGIIIISLSMHS